LSAGIDLKTLGVSPFFLEEFRFVFLVLLDTFFQLIALCLPSQRCSSPPLFYFERGHDNSSLHFDASTIFTSHAIPTTLSYHYCRNPGNSEFFCFSYPRLVRDLFSVGTRRLAFPFLRSVRSSFESPSPRPGCPPPPLPPTRSVSPSFLNLLDRHFAAEFQ